MTRLVCLAFATWLALLLPYHALADLGVDEVDPCSLNRDSVACEARGGATVEVYHDYHKRVRTDEMVTPLGSEVFGDNVSLYNGATEFRVVDIDLPGNGGPPMQLVRRLKVESRQTEPLGGFGAWDIDVPYVTGTFTDFRKWDTGNGGNTQRCSSAWMPQLPFVNFSLREIWSGFHMNIPGQGSREFYPISSVPGHPIPNDGHTYRWLARDNIRFRCTATTSNGYFGEGFIAIDGDGTTYHFDVGLERDEGSVRRREGRHYYSARRTRVYLMASKVEDRFGNWVQYHYSGVGPTAQLTGLSSSDGRAITLGYSNAAGYPRITSASAHGRTWFYGYANSTLGAPGRHPLQSVTLPDGSAWQYSYVGVMGATAFNDPDLPGCVPPTTPGPSGNFSVTATHPAGARARFDFQYLLHFRGGVPSNTCTGIPGDPIVYHQEIAHYLVNYSLTQKTLEATVGVPQMVWGYSYPGTFYPLSPHTPPAVCTNPAICPESKTVVVSQPDGSTMEYDFGVRFAWNDGRLLATRTKAPGGTTLRTETQTYVSEAEAPGLPFPDAIAHWSHTGSDDWGSVRIRPVKTTTINQQAVNFSSTVTEFDVFARPRATTKSSLLGNKTEYTSYWDNFPKWVVGQVSGIRVVEGGVDKWPLGRLFDPVTLLPRDTWNFHKLVERRTYHANGLPHEIYDGSAVKKTTLTNYHRGIPRSVTYHDGSGESAVVNDRGEIDSITDAVGHTTTYGYDLMGRLNAIGYPIGDSVAWAPTSIAFERVNGVEYGLPAGHWRQTFSTGNHRKITYFDGLWRPVLSREYDTANEAGTRRMVQRRFDHANRPTFASYPQNNIPSYLSSVTGTTTTYDALGRPLSVTAASEQGPLTTQYAYFTLFRTQVTNPRGQSTMTRYQAFDQPSTDAPIQVNYPNGAVTNITRDLFGKPTHLIRSGTWAGNSLSISRRYVYDAHERLCKFMEPESGITVMDYDASGNLAWGAGGLGAGFSGTTVCNRETVPASEKSTRTYDGRNRLTYIDHPAGTADVGYSYYADGAPWTVSSTDGGTWTYNYNKRRLLTGETLSMDGLSFGFTRHYSTNGHLSSLVYPDGAAINYLPNALGQPTRVANYATGISYHPNGAVAGFSYGNGGVHSQTLNARQLPLHRSDTRGGHRYLDYTYAYDKNGNLTGLLDNRPGAVETRVMDYDSVDRLIEASAPNVLGPEYFQYDPLDNLRTLTYPGRANLTISYDYATYNRLTRIHLADNHGNTLAHNYSYDTRGNMLNGLAPGHLSRTHAFDKANRMLWASTNGQTELFKYDGHGRRSRIQRSGGNVHQVYTRDGRFVLDRAANGTLTRHIHLGNRLLVSVTGSTPTYQHTDHLGSVVRKSDAAGSQTDSTTYAPYGSIQVGTLTQGPGFTGHVTDAASGLSYMQQRYHDPLAMRFVSVDPVLPSATDGGNFNRYWYANNNPYKFVDPDGRAAMLYPVYACASNPAACVGAIGSAAGAAYYGAKALLGGTVYSETVEDAATPKVSDGTNDGARETESRPNTNPYDGPVDEPMIVVDGDGNAIPVGEGEQVQGSGDGNYQQVKDRSGSPTGVRLDRGGHRSHADPKAQAPHGHRPGVTDEAGNPHLPINPRSK